MIRSNTWKRSRHTSWKQLCWLASAGILWILFLYQVTVSISLECPDKYFQTLTELLLHLHARTHGAFLCISVCYPSSASLEKRLPDVLKYFLLIRSHPACSEQSLQEMLQTGLQTSMLPSGELTNEIFLENECLNIFENSWWNIFWGLMLKYFRESFSEGAILAGKSVGCGVSRLGWARIQHQENVTSHSSDSSFDRWEMRF